MTKAKTALVIGGGHNGLICATYLAQAGCQVQLVERRDTVGGGAALHHFGEGYSVPALAQMHHPMHPKITKELKLDAPAPAPASAIIALSRKGQHLYLGENGATGTGLSAEDQAAYIAFKQEFGAYAKALGALYLNTAPRLKDFDLADGTVLAKLGWQLRFGLGRDAMREFLRVGGMNVYDILNEKFASPALKGALAAQAVLGNHVGPRTPTTALNYLYARFQELQGPASHGTQIADHLRDAASGAGVSITTGVAVEQIMVSDGVATGASLSDGRVIEADIVVSNADAKATFLNLVGPAQLDAMLTHRISKTRTNGDVSKVNLALDSAPDFAGLNADDLRHRMMIAPDMRYVERAFNASKYGEISQAPVLDIACPSAINGALAPAGHHVLSINVSFTPYRLKQGWDEGRAVVLQKVLDILEDYSPGIGAKVVASEVLSPVDIEAQYGITGGHWHHGEMSIDQGFMMRPVHGTAQYQTPIEGLFLCGAAAHPGGGITGLPGRNAARRILAKAAR